MLQLLLLLCFVQIPLIANDKSLPPLKPVTIANNQGSLPPLKPIDCAKIKTPSSWNFTRILFNTGMLFVGSAASLGAVHTWCKETPRYTTSPHTRYYESGLLAGFGIASYSILASQILWQKRQDSKRKTTGV